VLDKRSGRNSSTTQRVADGTRDCKGGKGTGAGGFVAAALRGPFMMIDTFSVIYLTFTLKGGWYIGCWLVEVMNEKLLMIINANLQTNSSIKYLVNRLEYY
jgi:hypothetical protein